MKQPKVNTTMLATSQIIRTDGEPDTCRCQDLSFESFDDFKRCCTARQEQAVKFQGSKERNCFECLNCPCGLQVMMGFREELPINVPLLKLSEEDKERIYAI